MPLQLLLLCCSCCCCCVPKLSMCPSITEFSYIYVSVFCAGDRKKRTDFKTSVFGCHKSEKTIDKTFCFPFTTLAPDRCRKVGVDCRSSCTLTPGVYPAEAQRPRVHFGGPFFFMDSPACAMVQTYLVYGYAF